MSVSLQERLDPKHSILIVVDMQNDFCHLKGMAAKRGRDMGFIQGMVPRLLELIRAAREIKFPIGFVRTFHNPWTESPVWREFQNPEQIACLEGSWGAEFHEGFEPRAGELVITKHRYSAFIGTDLDLILRSRGIKSLIVTGVGTGMCVFHTLTVGFMLDYHITLVEDCAATSYGVESHDRAVGEIKKHFGRVVPSSEVIQHWRGELREAG